MKQFWTAVLALLLALTACGCDQQEDPPASAGDTGSIPQHDTEELQPMCRIPRPRPTARFSTAF